MLGSRDLLVMMVGRVAENRNSLGSVLGSQDLLVTTVEVVKNRLGFVLESIIEGGV